VVNEDFLGGPWWLFQSAGREQLAVLLEHGLQFDSRVLDVGCGCLRAGRWIIPLLDPGCYFGIEPNEAMLARGLRDFIDPEIVAIKRPTFDHNDRFDFSVFGATFTHVIARSIWTHASKEQIDTMLAGLARCGAPGAVMLASYLPAGALPDYRGDTWVGFSHTSTEAGMVAHDRAWIDHAAAAHDLTVDDVDRAPIQENGQIWLRVSKPT
jgi:SAM-dependent methyltransferase